jgi:cell pole-organizing protein PopZ
MAQLNHEPSMEDILASIKRIIAEDGEPAPSRAPRLARQMAPEAETLEEEGPVAASAIAEAEAMPPEIDATPEIAAMDVETHGDVLELTSPLAEDVPAPTSAPAPMPETPLVATPKESAFVMDNLMSDPAAQASRSAFAALTQLQVRAEAGAENTLEGLVGDLLRPMLREWLDRELPALVERMVSAEIGRISGRG